MSYVITEACVESRDQSCAEVCPVDCIYEVERMLVIHPDECIDCGACLPECPVEAIFAEDDVPEGMRAYVAINAAMVDGIDAVNTAFAVQSGR